MRRYRRVVPFVAVRLTINRFPATTSLSQHAIVDNISLASGEIPQKKEYTMHIEPFAIERYFARHEFSAPYLLSCSDCQPLTLRELLLLADEETHLLFEQLSLGYTESQGHPLLREEISQLYREIPPDCILVTAPEEGIFVTMHALLKRGDHIIAMSPAYQSLYEIARQIGCTVTMWMPDECCGWKFNPAVLAGLVRRNTALIVVNFPHNPTGALFTREEFSTLLGIADEHSIPVFSDEMYRFLEHDPRDRLDSASDLSENAISLGGVSKSFGLAGLRIGWIATHRKDLLERIERWKDYTTICPPAPSEILALAALRAKEKIIERNRAIIAGNLPLLRHFFHTHARIMTWTEPKAGPVGFARMTGSSSAEDFCQELIEKTGVMLLPGNVFGYSRHVRIGFGRKDMPEALERLEEYLEISQSH